MALKKPTPAFENENEGTTAVAEKPAAAQAVKEATVATIMGDAPAPVKTEAAAPAAAPAAQAAEPAATAEVAVAATTAIAKASGSALAAQDAANQARAFKREVEEMKGASDFAFGNYTVYKGDNGQIGPREGDSFGRWVKVRLISWNDHTEISPGETGASSKDFVAYSQDGKTIDSVIGAELKEWVGKSCADYLQYLVKEEGFKMAKSRRFIDTACAVLASDSGEGPIGKVAQVTLSESSIPSFSRYQQDLADNAKCVAMALPGFTLPEDPFTFYYLREVVKKNNNTWTKLLITATLPAKF